MRSNKHNAALPPDYIPYQLRTRITQIDPKLDVFWQQHLHEIFTRITPQERKNIAEQLLTPNNIFWNSDKKVFEYRDSLNLSFSQICANIPAKFKNFKSMAKKVQASLEDLDIERDALKIADYLEQTLHTIAEFNTEDDLELQIQKQRFRRAFIYVAGDIIRHKRELILPETARKLSSDEVKVFINEVFLKHQVLGYWFKTMRQRQLKEFHQPLIREYLASVQKTLQLEVVPASGYIFIIAPMAEYSADLFTIRRFLLEDLLFDRTLLLNGIALPTANLDNPTPAFEDAFKRQIQCIVTLEGMVRPTVMDFVEKLNDYHEDHLLPLLFGPFILKESLENEIANRLKKYEQRLCYGILEPLAQTMRRLPNSPEEFDYLYISMRQLMGNIVSTFQDFQTQPAIANSPASAKRQAAILFARLVAYTALLEKRRSEIFTKLNDYEWKENHKKTYTWINYARSVAKKYIKEYVQRHDAVVKQEALVKKPENFFDKIFKNKKKQIDALNEKKKALRKIQYAAHMKLLYLPDDIKAQTVNMEFDTQVVSDGTMRTYAFPNGDNGISALPSTFSLPENRLQFDLRAFARQFGISPDGKSSSKDDDEDDGE